MAQPKQRTVTVVRVRPRKSIDKNQNIAFTPGKEVEISELMAKNRKLLDQEGYVLKSEYDASAYNQPTETDDAQMQIAELKAQIAAMRKQSNLEPPKAPTFPDTPHVAEAEAIGSVASPKPKATRTRKPSTRKTKAK